MSLKEFLFRYDFFKKRGVLNVNGKKQKISAAAEKKESIACSSSFSGSGLHSSYRTSYTVSYRSSYRTSYQTSYQTSYRSSYAASYRTSYQTSYHTVCICEAPQGVFKEIAAGGYGLNLV